MARIRTVKPEFHAHEELSALPPETHLLASALINYADDHGYFNANPVLVKAGTNPLRSDKTKIEDQLAQLISVGYIEIRTSGVKQYGKVINFEQHQKVSHPSPSKLRSKFESLPNNSGEIPEDSGNPPPLRELKGREQGTGNRERRKEDEDENFQNLWNANRGRLPETKALTTSRKKKLACRVKEGLTAESFASAVRLASRTPFCRGENDRGWKLDFDFLIENDTNLTKVLEGKYGTPDPAPRMVQEMSIEEALGDALPSEFRVNAGAA